MPDPYMEESKRQQIVEYLDGIFNDITTTNGYNFSIDEVICHATDFIPKENTISLLYRDTDDSISAATIGRDGYDEHELTIEVDIVSGYQNNTAEDGRKMLQDLLFCLSQDTQLGGLAQGLQLDKTTLSVQKQGNQIVNVFVSFNVLYLTQKFAL